MESFKRGVTRCTVTVLHLLMLPFGALALGAIIVWNALDGVACALSEGL